MADLVTIKKLIREIVGAVPNLPIPATVTAVNGETCSVVLKSGLKLTDVKLKASITESDSYLLMTPKIGSSVLVLSLSGELDNLSVIKVNEVEKIEYKENGLDILIDSAVPKVLVNAADNMKVLIDGAAPKVSINDGSDLEVLVDGSDKKVSVKNAQANLLAVSLELSAAIKGLKVFTSSGVSGSILPNTLTAVNQYETNIKKILK